MNLLLNNLQVDSFKPQDGPSLDVAHVTFLSMSRKKYTARYCPPITFPCRILSRQSTSIILQGHTNILQKMFVTNRNDTLRLRQKISPVAMVSTACWSIFIEDGGHRTFNITLQTIGSKCGQRYRSHFKM